MLFLDNEEILFLTGRKKRDAQILALRRMGIEHKIRPDGSAVILRSHIEKLLDGDSVKRRIFKEIQPNWGAINAKTTQG